jgi:hypothetical protein
LRGRSRIQLSFCDIGYRQVFACLSIYIQFPFLCAPQSQFRCRKRRGLGALLFKIDASPEAKRNADRQRQVRIARKKIDERSLSSSTQENNAAKH